MGKASRTKLARVSTLPNVPLSPVSLSRAEAAQRVADAEQVPIFEVDGEVFSVPRVEQAQLGLEYMAQLDKKGEELASWWLINAALGKDAVNALRSMEGLSTVEMDGIMTRVRAVITPASRKRPKDLR
jgi:hypothetical protein